MPELPDAKTARYVDEFGLERADAALLAANRRVAAYFEAVVSAARTTGQTTPGLKTIANWITGELFRLLNAAGIGIEAAPVSPAALAALLGLVAAGQLNLNSAKKVFGVMFETGRPAAVIVQELGLAQVSDAQALADAVAGVLASFPAEVARYRGGEQKLFGWLLGQVMAETRGRANPTTVRTLLAQALRA